MDSLVANLIQERSDSNIARLKTRLASREARIKQLEEEMEILRVDEEAVAVTKSLEEDLRNQVEQLTHKLEESKKHHTPVNTSLYLSLSLSLSSFLPSFLPPFLPLPLLFRFSSSFSSLPFSLFLLPPPPLTSFLPPFHSLFLFFFVLPPSLIVPHPYSSISPSLHFLSISFLISSYFVGDASL